MGVVTWKNIAPSNPSGILNSANQAAAALATAGQGIGDAVTGYVDDRQSRETDDFVADLMAAGSQEERDAMIGAAENAWLDLDQVNKTNYELGAPDREMDMFNEKLASETVVNQAAAKLAHERKLIEINEEGKYKSKSSGTPTSGPGSSGWGKTPIGSKGIFATNYPKNDNMTGWGGGYDSDDDEHFVRERGNFLNSTYATNLTNSLGIDDLDGYVNQLANDELITFEDRWTGIPGALGGGGDMFVFTTKDGVKHDLDGSKESQAALAELIQNTYFKASDGGMLLSKRQIDKKLYYDVFTANNPDLIEKSGYGVAQDIFTKIYNRHIKFDSNKLSTEDTNKIFKTLTGNETTTSATGSTDKYDDKLFKQVQPQAESMAKRMSREELQKFVDDMIKQGDAKSTWNWALTDAVQAILLNPENAK